MTPRIAVSLFTILISGCTSAALTTEEAAVKIVDPAQIIEMSSCKVLDGVSASGTRINGYRDQDLLLNSLKRTTAKVGGNVLVTRLSITEEKTNLGSIDISTQGQAYFCEEKVFKRLHSAENF